VTGLIHQANTDFRRTTLDNGLTVATEFMPGVRSVALGAWIRRASAHEPRELMGVSHLLEHMVFKGTGRRTAHQIALALETLGGSLDAFTSREHTSFQARVLDEHLPQAADVLSDLIFNPSLRDSDLALERKVVLEEIAMVEDTPDDLVFELHNAALWGDHPYGYSILGTRDTVSRLDTPALRELHLAAYCPQHIVVAAAGCVEHDALLETLARTGWMEPRPGSGDVPRVPPPRTLLPSRHEVEREGQQTHIVLGAPTVAHGDPRRYTLTLISLLLGGGMSSRLFQKVREELGLAYSVFAFQHFHHDTGVQGVYAGTSPESASGALEVIWRELESLARSGCTAQEVEGGKNQLKGQFTLSLESPASRMFRVAATELYGEPFLPLDAVLARIDAITVDEVAQLSSEFFQPEKQTVLTLGRKLRAA
jgi:predicted Zn-dependent peptidase